jgi:PDZ domain-containing protein
LSRALRVARRVVLSGPFVFGTAIFALALAAYTALSTIQTPYQILLPGPVTDVQRVIHPYPKPITGALYLTTIYSDPANTVELAAISLYAKFHDDVGIVPREESRPRNVPEPEYQRMLGRMMDESKVAAKVVALRELGYEVQVTGQGAQVQEVAENSAATGILQRGDVVVAADGQPVTTSSDLVALIQAHKPGETVRLRLRRDNAERDVSFSLGESPDEPGRARAGLVVLTHLYDYRLPKELDLETRDIGGPSAGLMFALGIYNAFSETDITRGLKIAGTGTINTDGRIGAVGGVKYKAMSVQRARADVFLVPQDNFDEARANAGRVKVVPIRTFRDALDALASLSPKT